MRLPIIPPAFDETAVITGALLPEEVIGSGSPVMLTLGVKLAPMLNVPNAPPALFPYAMICDVG